MNLVPPVSYAHEGDLTSIAQHVSIARWQTWHLQITKFRFEHNCMESTARGYLNLPVGSVCLTLKRFSQLYACAPVFCPWDSSAVRTCTSYPSEQRVESRPVVDRHVTRHVTQQCRRHLSTCTTLTTLHQPRTAGGDVVSELTQQDGDHYWPQCSQWSVSLTLGSMFKLFPNFDVLCEMGIQGANRPRTLVL